MKNKIKGIHWGITHKVLTGLVFIVIVAFLSSGLAKMFFAKFEVLFRTIPDQQLPALITATKLVQGTEKLISYAPDIVMADNPLLLESIAREITIRFQEDQRLVAQLQEIGFGRTGDLPRRFQLLFNNLQQLIDLVIMGNHIDERTFQLSKYLQQISKTIADLKNEIPEQHDTFYRVQQGFIQIFSLLRDVPNVQVFQNLKEYESLINESREMTEKVMQSNPGLAVFGKYQKILRRYGTGEKGIMLLIRDHLHQRRLIQDNLIESKFLSDELVKQTDKIFTTISQDIQANSRNIELKIRLLGNLLSVIPVVILCTAILIFLFIRHSVIGRILSLEQCMQGHVSGNPVPIPTDGKDEITSMAKSVSYFVTNRKEYEETLKSAIEKAETANRAKSVFLANMSHELRTPLNGILGYAQILKKEPGFSRFQKDGLDTIEQSGNHLLSLINDILDLAKIESEKAELVSEDFRLSDVIKDTANIIRIRAESKELSFTVEQSGQDYDHVHGDAMRLRQILLNLLSVT